MLTQGNSEQHIGLLLGLQGDVRSWSRDDVTKFVAMVPGCSEYVEVTSQHVYIDEYK